jgi:hypothetical protein
MGRFPVIMQKETKLSFGSLLVSIGVPYLIDKLFGPTSGLITAAGFAVVGILLFISWYADHEPKVPQKDNTWSRVGKFILVGAVLGAGVIVVIWGRARRDAQRKPAFSVSIEHREFSMGGDLPPVFGPVIS